MVKLFEDKANIKKLNVTNLLKENENLSKQLVISKFNYTGSGNSINLNEIKKMKMKRALLKTLLYSKNKKTKSLTRKQRQELTPKQKKLRPIKLMKRRNVKSPLFYVPMISN